MRVRLPPRLLELRGTTEDGLPGATARRQPEKATGGSPRGRKERTLAPTLEALSCVTRKAQGRGAGSASRGGQDLEGFQHDQVQPDCGGVNPPRDRPPAERPECAW